LARPKGVAIRAARTLLVERYGYLSGMITGANIVAVLGGGDGKAAKVRGVTRETHDNGRSSHR